MSLIYEALHRAGRGTAVIDLLPPPSAEPATSVDSSIPSYPFWRSRDSLEAEQNYRKGALFLARMAAEQRFRSILFCSARRHEGTTTAVLNLAHHLQENYSLRPLVIELDRQKPTLARLFKLDPDRCLRAALTGSRPARECIQLTPSSLSVIPGDRLGRADVGIDLASGLKRVLDEVEDGYDLVLLDAPPVLSHADAIVAGTIVPRIVLIVESGRTTAEVLDRVKREFSTDHIAVVGALLTKHRRHIPGWIYWCLGC